jgi:hypothetical protein
MIWRRLIGLAPPAAPAPEPASPSAAGRRLAQAGAEKRRAARAENIRRHCASIRASLSQQQEPAE